MGLSQPTFMVIECIELSLLPLGLEILLGIFLFEMGFDRYKREDFSRPNYRFFPNRTRAQTRVLSWAALGIGGFLTVFFLKAFEQNNERLRKYYDQLAVQNPHISLQGQVRQRPKSANMTTE